MSERVSPASPRRSGTWFPLVLLVLALAGSVVAAPRVAAARQCANAVHVVSSGETVALIAGRYRVTVAAIVHANNLADANRIEVGQRLLIPTCNNGAPLRGGPKRIEVDLSEQWMYAFEGRQLVFSAGVSSGKQGWETPVGRFRVYAKVPLQTMRGNARGEKWEVPDVPHILYFYRNAALHGAYWHNLFGTGVRLSHGCVNLPLGTAERLYNWAAIGTPVIVRK